MSYSVYFITNVVGRRSYIGFTGGEKPGKDYIRDRVRCHHLKLKASARATKSFVGGCILVATVRGFPDKKSALSFEWHSKRRRKKIGHPGMGHWRLRYFFATLEHNKFRDMELMVGIRVPAWIPYLQQRYSHLRVHEL